MQYFNIQVASHISGVASATIRVWEKRYKAVVPQRADNRHRLYSEKDIEKLALLYKLTEIGQSIGKIAHLRLDELKVVYLSLMHEPYDERQANFPQHVGLDNEKTMSSLLLALSSFKVDIIVHELDKAKNALLPRELCFKLILPLFQKIKFKVNCGELTGAQEQTMKVLTIYGLGHLVGLHYQKDFHTEELFLLVVTDRERDEITELMAALLCVHYKLHFLYLGHVPNSRAIAEAASKLKCKSVLLLTSDNTINDLSAVWKGNDLLKFDDFLGKLRLEKGQTHGGAPPRECR